MVRRANDELYSTARSAEHFLKALAQQLLHGVTHAARATGDKILHRIEKLEGKPDRG